MKKKSILMSMLTILTVTLLSVGFVSCGDDEPAPQPVVEDSNSTSGSSQTETTITPALVGAWKTDTDDGYRIYVFKEDGTGTDIEYWDFGDDEEYVFGDYTWKTKDNVLTIDYGDNVVSTYTFTVTSETLTLKWGQNTELLEILKKYTGVIPTPNTNPTPDPDPNPNPGDEEYPNRGPVASSFRGSGTKSDPYIISKASELRKLADDVTDKGKAYVGAYFSLTADITINENVLDSEGELNGYGDALEEWKPIGMQNKEKFQGTFDGNGHTISGIYINKKESNYMALFYGGCIQNLTIKDSYIEGYGATSSFGGNEVYNCVNYGTIKGYTCSGIGEAYTGIVENCKNYGKIYGKFYIAGISTRATINKCINYGVIKSEKQAFGVGGFQGIHSSVKNNCNMGRVIGQYVAGVSLALYNGSDVINNVNYGSLEGTYGGGIICHANWYANMENNVNVGRNEGGAKTYGLYYDAFDTKVTTMFKNNYYLSSSYLSMGENKKGYNGVNNRGMTEEEMKSQTFLDELNRNARALGSEYSRWKFGKSGFPILDWIEE